MPSVPTLIAERSDPDPEWIERLGEAWGKVNIRGPRSIPGYDPPDFSSLATMPSQQKLCVRRWELFLDWWITANEQMITIVRDPKLSLLTRDLIRSRPRENRLLKMHVISLAEPLDLGLVYNKTGFAISIGLLQDHERYLDWITRKLDQ